MGFFSSRLFQRLMAMGVKRKVGRQISAFSRAVESAPKTARRKLAEKLKLNGESDFAYDHDLSENMTPDEFRRAMPVTTYKDYQPYIQRMLEGQFDALLGPKQPLEMFALTSGTTAEPKHVPVPKTFVREYRFGWNVWGLLALQTHKRAWMRPIVQVSSPRCDYRCEAGIDCGAISGLLAESQHPLVQRMYTTPPEVARIREYRTRYYLAVRFALGKPVGFFSTANPSTLIELARTLDQNAESLLRDLKDGGLSDELELPDDLRRRLTARLKPNSRLARRLDEIRTREGVLKPSDVWQPAFLACWTGGTLGLYLHQVRALYGDVPIRDIGLLASEGRMSLPVADETPAGVLDVSSHFYEFCPAENNPAPDAETLLPQDLEEGKDYYILLTTSSGLWRYHIGDVVRCRGFKGQAPLIEFLHKGSQISSLTGEKLTAQQVVRAVADACKKHDIELTSFVLCPHWDDPPYYALNVHHNEMGVHLRREFMETLDGALKEANIEYASKRNSERLGDLRFRGLAEGFFSHYDNQGRDRQPGRADQYKHRFLETTPDADKTFWTHTQAG